MNHLTLTQVGPDLDRIVTLDTYSPEVGEGEALVAVEAAPVNNADILFAAGWFGVYPEVPSEIGGEGVGRVVAVGRGVDEALVGRRAVILPAFTFGTWAQEAVVPADRLIVVPEGIDARQLAMLPVLGGTAHALLHDYVALAPGDWIGLNLANSAVGHYVIPLARRTGIKILAVVRREAAAEQVRARGADVVLVDGDDLAERTAVALGGASLRLLLEGTGDPTQVAKLSGLVEEQGSVVSFAAATGQSPALPLADLIYRGVSLRAFYILRWLRDTPRARLEQIYAELAELVAEGVLRAEVEATYALDEFPAALAHAQRPARSGKVLFTPAGPAERAPAPGASGPRAC
jgi:NADPH:quinone reductase-like Zn-dependent oxidoreductase